MTDQAERAALACPACSPDESTVHEVLKSGGEATVRCTDCDHVHKARLERPREIDVDIVVSQDDESFSTTLTAEADETVAAGEEFIVDSPEAILQVRVTSVELPENRRVDEAPMGDVETVWARAVDNVRVNVTVHPNDGRRDDSRSLTVRVPGDYEFTVGEEESFGDETFEIEGIQVRGDSDGYRFDKFDRDGDMVFAKDVKRLYGRDERTSAWSAW